MLGVKHRIGGYRVIAPIGAGGFAIVYRGLDEDTGKEVAIKVLAENHSLVADTRRRFEEEMGMLMTVKSPSIARIYTVGTTEADQPYMVLELADRGDLRRRIEEVRTSNRTLGKDELRTLAHHLHDSLRHLHGMDIIHRDVSPGNILIRSEQGRGRRSETSALLEPGERFLLTDLGHAKDMILASGFTAGGGTRGFASPEQREDVTVVDHRADIFAATAILEWASHDGLFAEALDPFFDIGLAAEPEDRFDSMEEWFGFFSEEMEKTNIDGSQRSKVGKVFRRRHSGRAGFTDFYWDDHWLDPEADHQLVDDVDLDGHMLDGPAYSREPFDGRRPDALVADPASRTRPNGWLIPPPQPSGQAKVVLPPGSPGDQSIGRNRNPADRQTQDDPIDEQSGSGGSGDPEPGRGTSPLTRVDPEDLVDQLYADADRESRRDQGLRIAISVLALVALGAVGYGLTQNYPVLSDGLDAFTTEAGDETDPTTVDPDGGDGASDETAGGDEAGTDQTPEQQADAERPEELLVDTGSGDGPALSENGSQDGASEDPETAFGVTISAPDDGEVISGPLVVNGTARATDGIDQIQIAIRQEATGFYWDNERQRFGPEWTTVVVTRDQNTTVLPWSITVPEDELRSGDYQIRTWVEGEAEGDDRPLNDQRIVTVA